MRAGQLSDLLLFQARTLTYSGEAVAITWPTDFEEWGEAQRTSETVGRFFIRYRKNSEGLEIGPSTNRIIWDGAIWNITSAVHDRRRTMLTIDCDFSEMVEVTHMQSEVREYIDGLPNVRPQSE